MERRRLVAKCFVQQGLLVGKMSASRRRPMDCWFCKSFSLKMEGSLKINHQRLADISHKKAA
jgi:hypothetical protein